MWRFVGVLAVVGCNQIFDLEPPAAISSVEDADGDGIVDSRDNCVQTPNPDQSDIDHDRRGDACDDCSTSPPTRDRDNDGVDDACDSCVLGPQVDDDGDGVMDACDLCPVTPNPMQLDDDGDLVGNQCDEAAFQFRDNERVRFDPFTSISAEWVNGAEWEIDTDGTSIGPKSTTTDATLQWSDAEAAISVVSLRYTVEAGPGFSLDVQSGIGCTVSCVDGVSGPVCTLEARGVFKGGAVPVSIPNHGTLEVRQHKPQMAKLGSIDCTFYDAAEGESTSNGIGDVRTSISLRAAPGTKAHGVDLVY